jgi:hypothetical protein
MKQINSEHNNFQYTIEYSSDSDRSNCECDGICRCSKIVNVKIISVSTSAIVRQIVEQNNLKCNEIELYCIDRLVRFFKMYETSSWDATIGRGYYGEEIKDITFNHYEKVCQVLNEMLRKKSDKKIEYVLIKEYGYLLDSLKNAKYEIKEVLLSNIHLKQDYVKKVSSEDFYSDSEYTMIRAIVRPEEGIKGKFRLVDGFHRIVSTQKEKIKVLIAK